MVIGKVFAGKVMPTILRAQGSTGRLTIGAEQLAQLAEHEGTKGKAILERALQGAKDPNIEIAYNAGKNTKRKPRNFSVAGFTLRDGDRVLGNGAISITNPGTSKAVIKYRINLENGKVLQANGFVDGGQYASVEDMAISMSRKGGILTHDMSSGRAFANHIAVNEREAELASRVIPGGDHLSLEYFRGLNRIQQTIDKTMKQYRQVVANKGYTPQPLEIKPLADIKPKDFAAELAKAKTNAIKDFTKIKDLNFGKELAKKYGLKTDNSIKKPDGFDPV